MEPKENSFCKVKIEQFNKSFTPESVYILGYLWADGHISKTKRNTTRIQITTAEPENLREILKSTGDWSEYSYKPKHESWSTRHTFATSNLAFYNFLLDNEYGPNNKRSASVILNLIPKELQHYWFLGLIDGDGCWYFNEKYKLRQFQITSNIEQDWGPLEELFNTLGVKYSIDRRVVNRDTYKKPKHRSNIRIFGKESLRKLGEYVYRHYPENGIGMGRKYEKWRKCLEGKNQEFSPCHKYKGFDGRVNSNRD